MGGRFNRIEKYSVNLIKKRINFNVTRTRLGKHLTRNHCVYIYIYIRIRFVLVYLRAYHYALAGSTLFCFRFVSLSKRARSSRTKATARFTSV